jgi:hypothetical protein
MRVPGRSRARPFELNAIQHRSARAPQIKSFSALTRTLLLWSSRGAGGKSGGSSGAVSTAASPPRTFHPSPDDAATLRILTVDPAGGKYLAIAPNGDMFEYDVPGNQWSPLTTKAPQNLQVAIPVTSYGVVLFLSAAPAKVYVYKH